MLRFAQHDSTGGEFEAVGLGGNPVATVEIPKRPKPESLADVAALSAGARLRKSLEVLFGASRNAVWRAQSELWRDWVETGGAALYSASPFPTRVYPLSAEKSAQKSA
jgi:hypothetical protein